MVTLPLLIDVSIPTADRNLIQRWTEYSVDKLWLCEEVTKRLWDALKKVDLVLSGVILLEDAIPIGTQGVYSLV